MKNNILVLGILICLFLVGCAQQQQTQTTAPQTSVGQQEIAPVIPSIIPQESELSTKPLSEMALQLSDFPSGWVLQSRVERTQSDVSKEGIALGWKEGYKVSFIKTNPDNDFFFEKINQYISRYSLENVTKAMQKTDTNEMKYEPLRDVPQIENVQSFKVLEYTDWGEGDIELTDSYYMIQFYKKDIYMAIYSEGTVTDYETLKKIAEKAYANIK